MRTRFSTLARGALLSLPLLAAFASTAAAQHHHHGMAPSDEPVREMGFGTAFGGGIMAAGIVGLGGSNNKTGLLPSIYLPTFEFKYFFQPQDISIDVSVPLTNVIIGSAALGGFYFQTDAMVNFNVGKGSVRLVAGPGLGLDIAVAGSSSGGSFTAFGIRVPAQIGFEVLTERRGFGFSLVARPWAEIIPAGGVAAVGGGANLMLQFMGYVTKHRGR